ncbi:ATP-binding cassette domain-containing protein [bacterium]|nr:ATP-binding cassette domain-containing protein [bacterium]
MSIDIINLRKQFGNTAILKGISVSFSDHGKYLIKGENGIGKSTLFRAILNQISYLGEINTLGSISYAPEGFNFPPYMTVYKAIKTFSTLTEDIYEFDKKLDELLELFNFKSHKYSLLGSLSKGEKQKVNVIQAYLTPSKTLLLDEPLSGLDISAKEALLNLIKKDDRTVIIISHELTHFKKKDFNILELEDGHLTLISKVH